MRHKEWLIIKFDIEINTCNKGHPTIFFVKADALSKI